MPCIYFYRYSMLTFIPGYLLVFSSISVLVIWAKVVSVIVEGSVYKIKRVWTLIITGINERYIEI